MRDQDINIVAIHQHMTHEQPYYLFLHYWGKGKAGELAKSLKKVVDLQVGPSQIARQSGGRTCIQFAYARIFKI